MTNATHITPIDSDGKLCTHLPRCKQEIVSMIGVGYNPPFMTVKTEEPRGEITWENLKEGNYLQHSDGTRVKVLAVLGDCILPSNIYKHDYAGPWVTKKEINKEYWSIVQPITPIREVTQAEVNEKFGEEVRIKG